MGKNKGEMKYHTLKESLKNDILSGVYQPGDKMPSENQLVQEYDLSRHTVRKALSILEEEGYEVVTTYSGDEAWETFERISPDLVLLDFRMPGLNGHFIKRNQTILQWLQPIFLIIYSLD